LEGKMANNNEVERLKAQLQETQEALKIAKKELKEGKETNARQKKELARQKKELKEGKETNARQKKELERQKKELDGKSLEALSNYYPILKNRTATSAHYSKHHKPAELKQYDVEIKHKEVFDRLQSTCTYLSDFWKTPFSTKAVKDLDVSCDSEIAAQSRVVQLLESVISGLKLNNMIEVVQNRMLAGNECDILLVHRTNRLPFAPIEVKKPGFRNKVFGEEQSKSKDPGEGQIQTRSRARRKPNESCEMNLVAGQVLDECLGVKLFGFSNVYGMLTDWNHWRLSCAREITPMGDTEFAKLRAFYPTESTQVDRKDSSPPPLKFDFSEQEQVQLGEGEVVQASGAKRKRDDQRCLEDDRILYCTETVPDTDFDDSSKEGKEIVSFVALFVIRAFLSVHALQEGQIDLNNKKLPCRVLSTENKDQFAFGSVTTKSLTWQANFPKRVTKLSVVHPLGYGDSGECCIAVTGNGSVWVVKFFRGHKDMDPIKERVGSELQNWNVVYGEKKDLPKCFTMDVPNGPCLVMPFLKPVLVEERKKLLDECKIKTALKFFASSGFIHCDVQWRHFGWWHNDLLMLDLGNVKRVDDKSQRQKWIIGSLGLLTKRIGTEP